jgi:hypothetical protein
VTQLLVFAWSSHLQRYRELLGAILRQVIDIDVIHFDGISNTHSRILSATLVNYKTMTVPKISDCESAAIKLRNIIVQ